MITKRRKLFKEIMTSLKPPKKIKIWEWADKNRTLASDYSAEPGRWKSKRTPYMIPIMEAFTDPNISHIYVMASAQVGKSELLNNCFGYIVDVAPGPVLWIHPTVKSAEDYSKERISTLIRDTPAINQKMHIRKSRDKSSTILNKTFNGGHLALIGSNAPSGLRSRPIRYILGDEWDAWAHSAQDEGDPAKLAEKRTTTYFNRKVLMVSTPVIKGMSKIEEAYLSGTQEEWQIECPNCEEYHFIIFENIEFDKKKRIVGREEKYSVSNIFYRCPDCGFKFKEYDMKNSPGIMTPHNMEALKRNVRSFRLNAFVSPWESWENIIIEFLEAHKDPNRLQVVVNTLFGETFEDRGDIESEEDIFERRENYGCELPEGVLVLTCGVDTQDDRLEYEIVGHGFHGEEWGIQYGVLPGNPSDNFVWQQLDKIISKTYRFKNGRGLKIASTFIDSGGHKTTEVYEACRERIYNKVFAIKGKGGSGIPFVANPRRIKYFSDQQTQTCWLYILGVDSGKTAIMRGLKVQAPGPRYLHFPLEGNKGYDQKYFEGLLSERMVSKRRNGQNVWGWELIPGRRRNEPLDLRNYARAAFESLHADLVDIENRLKGFNIKPNITNEVVRKKMRKKEDLGYEDW